MGVTAEELDRVRTVAALRRSAEGRRREPGALTQWQLASLTAACGLLALGCGSGTHAPDAALDPDSGSRDAEAGPRCPTLTDAESCDAEPGCAYVTPCPSTPTVVRAVCMAYVSCVADDECAPGASCRAVRVAVEPAGGLPGCTTAPICVADDLYAP